MKLALIGAGNRGNVYALNALNEGHQIVCIVDPHLERRDALADKCKTPLEGRFSDAEDFFKQGKLADALIIASLDQAHYGHAMRGLDVGYPLLLEKPISNNPVECLEIRDKALASGLSVTVCHVLRYAPFFKKIKEIVDSGVLGKIITIQHNENIGNFHMAHSYVRGNWRREEETAPIMLAKSCHDLDILIWLTGSAPESVASFGDLTYFKEENAPKDSAARCLDCAAAKDCRFDVKKCYLPIAGHWPATVLTADQTEEGLMKAFKEGPYGRCVYRCDNDVCDHQVSIIKFKNGVTATFHLSGLTDRNCRTLKVMCENGEIRANMDLKVIETVRFSSNPMAARTSEIYHVEAVSSGHGGGDAALTNEFLRALKERRGVDSSIDHSTASHILGFAAEKARRTNTVVNIDEFEKSLKR